MFNGINLCHPSQSYRAKHRAKKNEKIRRDLDSVGLREQAEYNCTKMDPNQTVRSRTTQFLNWPCMIPGPNLLTVLPALYYEAKQKKHQSKHWAEMVQQQAKSNSGAPYGVRKTVFRHTADALQAVAASLLSAEYQLREVEPAHEGEKKAVLDDREPPVFKVPVFIPKKGSGLCRRKPQMLEILTNDEDWARHCVDNTVKQLKGYNFFDINN